MGKKKKRLETLRLPKLKNGVESSLPLSRFSLPFLRRSPRSTSLSLHLTSARLHSRFSPSLFASTSHGRQPLRREWVSDDNHLLLSFACSSGLDYFVDLNLCFNSYFDLVSLYRRLHSDFVLFQFLIHALTLILGLLQVLLLPCVINCCEYIVHCNVLVHVMYVFCMV